VPAAVFDTFGFPAARAIFVDAGVEVLPSADGTSVEAIAAARPSRILGVSIPTTVEAVDRLTVIAPTTVLEYAAGWEAQLRAVADPIGRADAADQVVDRLRTRVGTTRADLAAAGVAGRTVSVIATLEGEGFALARSGGTGAVLSALGLARPAAQDVDRPTTDPFVEFAGERLTEHDADHLYLLSGSGYDAAALAAAPLCATLRGAPGATEVLGEMWFGGSAFAIDWIVGDLRATLLGDGAVLQEADAVRQWASFARS
jgi:iron complex transport system substrate-binding protein